MERLDRFMARANAAYYATHDPFRDFTTSPEISQVFGEILGLWAAVTWEQIGRPDPVLLVEAGPGRGTLMADALRAVAQRGARHSGRRCALHLIETSPRLRAVQAERLPEAIWHDGLDDAAATGRCCCWPTSSSTRCRSGSSSGAGRRGWSGMSRTGGSWNVPRPLPQPPPARGGGACTATPPPLAGGGWGEGPEATVIELNEPALAIARDCSAPASPPTPAPRSSSTTAPSTAPPATASRRCAMAGRPIRWWHPAPPT